MSCTMKGSLYTIAVAVAAALLAGGTALAQEVQEIKVQATRVMSTEAAGRTTSGVPIHDITLSYGVSTAGLDLTTSTGATALESRVKEAAAAACKEIGDKHPEASPSDAECARKATAEAMMAVHQLVTAAQKTKK